ncbi:MAG: helix-turn-helix domain-containing protein [Clostridiales bacterium]|nr:helix-turn-helix domain-containing protein [Clostridiales bacterium]
MNRDLMGLIVRNDDGAEIVNYDDPGFPSYIYDGWIQPKVTWEKVPHFHEDVELVSVKSGSMAYVVNGKTLMLHEGDTIFVNSNQIHYSMSVNDETAKYVICVIHPSILTASVKVEMDAIKPITDNPDIPYVRFRYINEFTKDMYNLMMELPDIRNDAFAITMQFFKIWEIIRKQCAVLGKDDPEVMTDSHKQLFKSMMLYISENYQETVTLDGIAASANISKSMCNNIFHKYVGESPVSYVMHFRARKVAEYLRSTDMSLGQIAEKTGFNGVSYMSETFKKFFEASPRDYRKQWRRNDG